ncbi:MAG: dienelactone hydrolase family protein [Myxococcaceae bacterium]
MKLSAQGLAACQAVSAVAQAAVETKAVDYKDRGKTYQGYFAWDAARKDRRPGVLVIHEWWGHNAHARKQAERFAKEGYVAFALDLYGKGKLAKHPKDAQAMSTEATKDPAAVKARFEAALAELKKIPAVDPEKIAVVGYCMGGTIALGMAAAGEDLDAVATFHAGLSLPSGPPAKGSIKPRIQVNTGADDPMVSAEAVEKFKKEMTEAGSKVEVISYPGAKHAFTNPEADKHKLDALAYNKDADQKSFDAAIKFFKEVFGG